MKHGPKLAALAAILLMLGCPLTDTTNPVVTIVVPTNGATLAPGTITIKAVATDNKGVSKVEFYVGVTKLGEDATGTADTFDVTWTAAVGAYTLKAVASDAAGNLAEHTVAVTIQTGGGGTGPTEHGGAINADETWWPSGNPHIIKSDINVQNNATLTIKPGCIIKVNAGNEIYVGYFAPGAIIAEGTADSLITFTSNVASPGRGDWEGIGIYDLTTNTTSFKYCVIEYAGSRSGGGAVYSQHDGLKFANNVVRQSQYAGVYCADNAGFTGFSNNTITQCGTYPLALECEAVRTIGAGNAFTGNNYDAIYVKGGNGIKTSGDWVNPGVPYVIANDINIGDNSSNPVIVIAPGTTLKMMSDVEFYVGYFAPGGLIADGTTGQITFTSNINPPSPGDWRSLSFYDKAINSQSKLINCKIEYAGAYSNGGNLHIEDCTPTVIGDSIGHSLHYGIHLGGSEHPAPATLRANNTIYDNPDGDIYP